MQSAQRHRHHCILAWIAATPAQAQSNNESCNSANSQPANPVGCTGEKSFLIDYQGSLWVQIPLKGVTSLLELEATRHADD